VTTQIYSVPGISCAHCKQTIEDELAKVDEVSAVAVDISAKTVRVDGDAPVSAVRAAIEAAGYEVIGAPG
jgi:copper chaperone CopZ